MALRDTIAYWRDRAFPVVTLLVIIAIAVILVEFVPARGAAALLGILVAAALTYSLSRQARQAVQLAVLWFAIGITADAAYARLNDQTPLTVANTLTKVVDALVKLADPLIRGLGLGGGDPRAKVVAVAPDFVWALILSTIALLSASFLLSAPGRR